MEDATRALPVGRRAGTGEQRGAAIERERGVDTFASASERADSRPRPRQLIAPQRPRRARSISACIDRIDRAPASRISVRLRGRRAASASALTLARADARHRVRRDHDRRLDRVAEDRHPRHRSLCARRDRAQRRTADRLGRRRRVLCLAPTTAAGRSTAAATCVIERHHAAGAVLDADALRSDGRLSPMRSNRHGFTSQEIVAPRRRQLRDRRRAARARRQLAADRRRRALRAGAAPLRHAGRRRDARRREGCADAGGRLPRGRAHDPLAALAARRAAARRHRASRRRCCCCRAPRRRTPIRGSPPIAPVNSVVAAAAADAGRAPCCRSWIRPSPPRSAATILPPARSSSRAGQPGLYVGVVLHAQRRRLLRDQRPRRRPPHHRARSDDAAHSAPNCPRKRTSPRPTG